MTSKNILQEALADSKSIKEAAYENAQNIVMEHLQEDMKNFVNSQLNEGYDNLEEEDESAMANENEDLEVEEGDLGGEEEGGEGEDLADAMLGDDEEGEGEDDGSGFEADLDEALAAALSEVDHAKLGEPAFVDPENEADSKGLMKDKGDQEWEEQDPEKPHDYYGPVPEAKYKAKIAQLVKENMLYKKANKQLKESLKEVQLFNNKVLHATKLLQTEGLSKKVKSQIVENLDGAKSINEVKSIYNTWKAAIGVISENAKKAKQNVGTASSLSEALGSQRGTGKGVSQVQETPVEGDDALLESVGMGHLRHTEGQTDVGRLQRLAGIVGDDE